MVHHLLHPVNPPYLVDFWLTSRSLPQHVPALVHQLGKGLGCVGTGRGIGAEMELACRRQRSETG